MTEKPQTMEQVQAENVRLRQRIAELEQAQADPGALPGPAPRRLNIASPNTWQSWELLQTVLDVFPDPIFVKDRKHRWIACNQAFCHLIGHGYDDIIGYSDPDRWPPEQAAVFWEKDDEVFLSGEPNYNEEFATGQDGITRTIWTRKFPMYDADGHVIGLCGIITDVSDLKRRQQEIARLEAELQEHARQERLTVQQEIIDAQQKALRELSTPLIPIADDVVIMPLVGTIDSQRAQQILESLLQGVGTYRATTVILDITGVQLVDSGVANTFIRAAQAVKLLGAQVAITGIQPQIAQTLVNLGAELSGIITYSTLRSGITSVLREHSRS